MNESGIKSHVFRHLHWFQTRLEAVERLLLGDFNGPQESASIKMMEWHYSLAASSEGEVDKLHRKKRKWVCEPFVGHIYAMQLRVRKHPLNCLSACTVWGCCICHVVLCCPVAQTACRHRRGNMFRS